MWYNNHRPFVVTYGVKLKIWSWRAWLRFFVVSMDLLYHFFIISSIFFLQVSELNSKSYLLQGGTRILSDADMNSDTYKVPGNYYVVDNATAETLKNAPFTNEFILKVEYSLGNSQPRQTFTNYITGQRATRRFNGTEWLSYTYFSDDATILEQSCKYIRYLNSGTQQTVDFNNLRENYPLIVSAMDDAYKRITFLNSPVDITVGGFALISIPVGTSYALQIFYKYNTVTIYYRASMYSSGSNVWLPWQSINGSIVS